MKILMLKFAMPKGFCLKKKKKEKNPYQFCPSGSPLHAEPRSAVTSHVSPGGFTSRASKARVTFFFFAAKLHFDERWIWIFISFLFGKWEVRSKTAEGESHASTDPTRQPGPRASPSPAWGSPSGCGGLSGQARGVKAVEVEDDIRDTEAVICFSLKCLKVGRGPWLGPTGPLCPRRGGPALITGREGLPRGTVRLQKSRRASFPNAVRSPEPLSPPALRPSPPPTTESKTFQPAEPGAGVPSRCLPRPPGPMA